ncbi:uncharacterized protein LOC113641049 [Tachysurus fulvidraco]|uniref:uncharacterized protein LOC113641049 n=1 Tax=Tachysurus fulvidraco TaxID=1234273 RepID=UPI001FEE1EF9|nr:uncharacterized protein LOC113641049 [Tachysurus fulvidraco]XP_026999572.2 uncharacterized protein LOC113641049 [Tachysurus fulvidraco]XP_047678504.1 uncharacterized protein LOC113641049 [Tachysurus fulvidraco]
MNLRKLTRLLLLWITLHLQTPDGSVITVNQDLSDTNSKINLEEKWSTFQIKPKFTVRVVLGNTTELQCRNESSEGLVLWWQTPFGSFGERYKFSDKDPIEMRNGNLRIPKVTLSHIGVYTCLLVDSRGTTVILYKVNVLNENTPKTRTGTRTARDAETSGIHYTHFIAVVSSSVLVTFIGAFTIGAFSQPYVITCLQRTRTRMRPKQSSPRDTTRVSRLSTVFFQRNPNSKEDTVHFAPKSSASTKAAANMKTDQDENQNGAHQEGGSVSSDVGNDIINTSNGKAGDEADQEKDQEGQEHKAGLGLEQPKRISRVIKLYNYDEDGNRYNHIKEQEVKPTPRQRVASLSRLQSIMNEAETHDFSSSRISAGPDDT